MAISQYFANKVGLNIPKTIIAEERPTPHASVVIFTAPEQSERAVETFVSRERSPGMVLQEMRNALIALGATPLELEQS